MKKFLPKWNLHQMCNSFHEMIDLKWLSCGPVEVRALPSGGVIYVYSTLQSKSRLLTHDRVCGKGKIQSLLAWASWVIQSSKIISSNIRAKGVRGAISVKSVDPNHQSVLIVLVTPTVIGGYYCVFPACNWILVMTTGNVEDSRWYFSTCRCSVNGNWRVWPLAEQ